LTGTSLADSTKPFAGKARDRLLTDAPKIFS